MVATGQGHNCPKKKSPLFGIFFRRVGGGGMVGGYPPRVGGGVSAGRSIFGTQFTKFYKFRGSNFLRFMCIFGAHFRIFWCRFWRPLRAYFSLYWIGRQIATVLWCVLLASKGPEKSISQKPGGFLKRTAHMCCHTINAKRSLPIGLKLPKITQKWIFFRSEMFWFFNFFKFFFLVPHSGAVGQWTNSGNLLSSTFSFWVLLQFESTICNFFFAKLHIGWWLFSPFLSVERRERGICAPHISAYFCAIFSIFSGFSR